MRSKQSGVKMSDIAQASGVSTAAVSLVINNKPGVSEETRQRIMEIARSLGYKQKSTNTNDGNPLRSVGLMIRAEMNDIDKGQSNVFYSHIIAGIEIACRERNLPLLLTSILVDENNYPVEIPQMLSQDNAGGYILVGIHVNAPLDQCLHEIGAPVVLVDAYTDGHPHDAVLTANGNATYQSVRYLLDQGHRHIGFVGAQEGAYPSFEERRQAYRKCMQDYGLTQIRFADSSDQHQSTKEAARQLLLNHPELTALVGVNDDAAIGAMHAALEMGLHIPNDISVVGFDDIIWAERMSPPLTTMQIDKINMGYLAIELLRFRAEKPNAHPVTVLLHPKLIERNSVRSITD
jgi:DNA-binding LacI/PurR family transcriptional regulator